MSVGQLCDPVVTEVFARIAEREASGPEVIAAALPEDAASMTPDELATTFAALPNPQEWDRLDEEFSLS